MTRSAAHRPRRSRYVHNLFLTSVDAQALTDAVVAEFPDIRFLSTAYAERFVDSTTNRWRAHHNALRSERGEPPLANPIGVWSPDDLPIQYSTSLADPTELSFNAWQVPAAWTPDWTWIGDGFHLRNPPESGFAVDRGKYFRRSTTRQEFWGPPRVVPPRVPDGIAVVLDSGAFHSWWFPDSPRQRALAERSNALLLKLTTDCLVSVSTENFRPIGGSTRNWGSAYRAGHDAVRWALNRRHNYFGRPGATIVLKPADYPYAPEEYIRDFDWSFGQKMPEHMAAREAAREERRRAKEAAKAAAKRNTSAGARRSGGKKRGGAKPRG